MKIQFEILDICSRRELFLKKMAAEDKVKSFIQSKIVFHQFFWDSHINSGFHHRKPVNCITPGNKHPQLD